MYKKYLTKEFLHRISAGGKLVYMATNRNIKPKDDNVFKNISSPFRKDSNPSFQIFRNQSTNTWYFKDFGDNNCYGDMYTYVSMLYNIDVIKEFPSILNKIGEILNIEQQDPTELERIRVGGDGTNDTRYFNLKIPNIEQVQYCNFDEEYGCNETDICLLKQLQKNLDIKEKEFLAKTGIDFEIMQQYHTYFLTGYSTPVKGKSLVSIRKHWMGIWICYDFGSYCKIYIPNPKKFWYIGNKQSNHLFGTPQKIKSFDSLTRVYLTAGEKDALVLLSRGYHAMCLNSETQSVKAADFEAWRSINKYDVCVVYDIDKTGIEQAQKLHAECGAKYILLPDWIKNNSGKDVTDFFSMGGTIEEFNDLPIIGADPEIDLPVLEQRQSVRTAQQRIADASLMPDILPHADVLFQSNELVILFGDTGKGKSILAVGLADAISKGGDFLDLENKCEPQIVLYYDFELSDKQFQKRYSNSENISYQFNDNLFIDNIDLSAIDISNKKIPFEEHIINKIRVDLQDIKAKVLIIDNITFLTTFSSEDGQVAMKLMKLLKQLKTTEQLSILVLAHTPKRFGVGGLTLSDLAGSKHLSNFADSVMALGVSKKDTNLRYIIQVKASRTGEIKYDADNVILCEIQKPDNFLNMVHVGYAKEFDHLVCLNPDNEDELKAKAFEMHKNGIPIRQIAESIGGVSKSKVGRWLQTEKETIK